jgi:hypothetical protein
MPAAADFFSRLFFEVSMSRQHRRLFFYFLLSFFTGPRSLCELQQDNSVPANR